MYVHCKYQLHTYTHKNQLPEPKRAFPLTGVADPDPVGSKFLREPVLSAWFFVHKNGGKKRFEIK